MISRAGRDKSGYFIVTDVEDNYAYLTDGSIRKIENPKKKKIKHLELTKYFDNDMAEKLVNKNKITNQDIKRVLRELLKSEEED